MHNANSERLSERLSTQYIYIFHLFVYMYIYIYIYKYVYLFICIYMYVCTNKFRLQSSCFGLLSIQICFVQALRPALVSGLTN